MVGQQIAHRLRGFGYHIEVFAVGKHIVRKGISHHHAVRHQRVRVLLILAHILDAGFRIVIGMRLVDKDQIPAVNADIRALVPRQDFQRAVFHLAGISAATAG